MKIRKTILGLLTASITFGVVTPIITSLQSIDISLELLDEETKIDYSQVRELMNNKQQINDIILSESNQIQLSPEQETKIEQIQDEYIDLFESNDYSLEQVKDYMSNNFSQYKEELEKTQNQLDEQTYIQTSKCNFSPILCDSETKKPKTIEDVKQELIAKNKSLKTERKVVIGFGAGFSAAAAAFFVAAFFTGGGTLDWGISCSAAAAQSIVMTVYMNKESKAIEKYAKTRPLDTLDIISSCESAMTISSLSLSAIGFCTTVVLYLAKITPPIVIAVCSLEIASEVISILINGIQLAFSTILVLI